MVPLSRMNTKGVPPTRQEALDRIARLDLEIQKRDALVKERTLLVSYVDILDQLEPDSDALALDAPKVLAPPQGAPSRLVQVYVGNPTGDTAYDMLKRFGPLDLTELLKKVRENKNWKSSGDDKKDKDRLWAAMHRDTGRFTKVADRKWDAKRNSKV